MNKDYEIDNLDRFIETNFYLENSEQYQKKKTHCSISMLILSVISRAGYIMENPVGIQ